jgi:hypothetical protein
MPSIILHPSSSCNGGKHLGSAMDGTETYSVFEVGICFVLDLSPNQREKKWKEAIIGHDH